MNRLVTASWEVPLGVASRIGFVVVRWWLRRIAGIKLQRGRETNLWQLLSDDLLRRWFALPVVISEGPRWNTHATIGRVGPLAVAHSLDFHLARAADSARQWTIVVYTFPEHVTMRVISPRDLKSTTDGYLSLALPSGKYSLIVRYYDPTSQATLPELRVDGQACVAALPVPADTNAFYQRLSQRSNLAYRLLQFHAYAALRYRRWLSPDLVKRIYLPVGNPETDFRYGALAPGESLRVQLADGLVDRCDVYITFYDLASFPLSWQRLSSGTRQFPPASGRRTFLIRIHQVNMQPPKDSEIQIEFAEKHKHDARASEC